MPTLVELAGGTADSDLPGTSLSQVIAGRVRPRVGFAEYHATGSFAGSFLLRDGTDKLIYHVGMPRQLFDLAVDPEECHDLIEAGRGAETADRLEAKLRRICDPEAVDAQAKADQRAHVAAAGGREAVLQTGALVFSPPPGIAAERAPTTSIRA